ncbi:hypothetical protein KAR91_65410 [Candidatus Pacearchaeota archaeon]|nr:hypothetical protein [Candidatus Pacearchaeota archaeon]
MRGTRAKRLRRIAMEHEPRKNKHGLIQYYYNEKSHSVMCGGFRGVYLVFKRAYKKLRREDNVYDQNAVTKIS